MRKYLILFIVLSLLFGVYPVYADNNIYNWDYYTFSLPDGYFDTSPDQYKIEAYNGEKILVLARINLTDLGISFSSDLIGEDFVLKQALSSVCPFMDETAPYEEGEINGAAYIITSGDLGSDGSSIKVSILGLLKKNCMVYGFIFNPLFLRGRIEASDFIHSVTVNDKLDSSTKEANYEWDIATEANYTNVSFIDFDRVVKISFPKPYEVFMPGMGEISPVPGYLAYTPSEMEDFMATLTSTMSAYSFAYNPENGSRIFVIFNHFPIKQSELNKNGEYSQNSIDEYYNTISNLQGPFEKRTLNNRTFYVYPEYSNGYKLRSIFGQDEITVLCKTPGMTYTDEIIDELNEIAGSITVSTYEEQGQYYYVAEADITMYLSPVWKHITEYNVDRICKQYDVDSEPIKKSLNSGLINFIAINFDLSQEFDIDTCYSDIDNLSDQTPVIHWLISKTRKDDFENAGFSVDEDRIIKLGEEEYIVISGQNLKNGDYYINYYTIRNNTGISLLYTSLYEPFSESTKVLIDNYVASIKYGSNSDLKGEVVDTIVSAPMTSDDVVVQQGQTEEFIFHNGITWGMSRQQVEGIEQNERKTISKTKDKKYEILEYSNASFKDFPGAVLSYIFYDNSLYAVSYDLAYAGQKFIENAVLDLTTRYGEPDELTNELILKVANSVFSPAIEASGGKKVVYDESMIATGNWSGSSWDLPDRTTIVYLKDGKGFIFLAPERSQDKIENDNKIDELFQFEFRDGIKWGMSKEDVRSMENYKEANLNVSPEERYDAIGYLNVSLSAFPNAGLLYLFQDDQLCSAFYFLDGLNQNSQNYLNNALRKKYGEVTAISKEEKYNMLISFTEILECIDNTISKEDIMEEDADELQVYWLLPDGTSIFSVVEEGTYMLVYLSPIQEDYDISGL